MCIQMRRQMKLRESEYDDVFMEALGTDLPADRTRRQKIALYWVEVEPTNGSSMNRVTEDKRLRCARNDTVISDGSRDR